MKMKLFALSAALCSLLLVGCATSETATSKSLTDIVRAERGAAVSPVPQCQVPADMVGKPHTDVAKLKLKSPMRVIFPGSAVTSDYVSNRLNFKVDKKGIIRSITCG